MHTQLHTHHPTNEYIFLMDNNSYLLNGPIQKSLLTHWQITSLSSIAL